MKQSTCNAVSTETFPGSIVEWEANFVHPELLYFADPSMRHEVEHIQ